MANQRNKRIEEQSDPAVSQSKDKNYNVNLNKNRTGIKLSNINASKKLLLEKIAMCKTLHESKCEDAKTSSSESRIKSLNKIQTLHDKVGH